ncbi:hypothetical protein RhiirA5_425710 [Rhizophagus irregularis]|uniref:Uncharacterized protein n=2 Tax=Rhizophagus irregularis TaxID=588596 RepID=A0A2N0P5K6_9GLOM|nr:hypothetical protein RhiirA5_425710 [Rhizophagus irregularis]
MELDWESYINFPKNSEDTFYTSFPESNSNELKNITPPNSYFSIELENITILFNSYFSVEDTSIPPNNNFSVVEPLSNAIESIELSESLSNDTSTSDYSTYYGNYEARKKINQNEHRVRDSNKTECEWHCNFKLPKTEQQIRCTILVDVYNHELNSTEIAHLNARYR